MIVQFTQALLAKELRACEELQNSATVKGAFIFVCRQMYNTCEGLQVLRPYSLHECIAQAWRKVTLLVLMLPVAGSLMNVFFFSLSLLDIFQRQVCLHGRLYTVKLI